MKTITTLCMALKCEKKVKRHPINFDTGFCLECQKLYNKTVLETLTK